MRARCSQLLFQVKVTDAPKLGAVTGAVAESKSGAPVPKALVILRGNQKAGAGDAGIGTRTSASGSFAFSDLEPGTYQTTVERAGYVSAPENEGKTVTVKAGETTSDFKLTLLRTGAISGHVFDTDGEPLAGVSVQVLKPRKGTGGWGAISDDLGEYRAFNLAPGKYKVVATFQGSGMEPAVRMQRSPSSDGRVARDAYATVYYPGTIDSAQALAITVETGADLRGINFQMVRTHAVRVRGQISGLTGVFTTVNLQPSNQGSGGQTRDAVVTPKGEFELADVLPGTYWLSAASSGLDSASRFFTRRLVQVGDQDIDDLQLALSAGQKLTGRLVPPEGRSLPHGLFTFLESRVPGDTQQSGAVGQVSPDGAFSMRDIAPGDYDAVIASADASDDDLYIASIKMGEVDALAEGVHISEVAPEPLVFTLKPKGGAITSTVHDDQGRPVPDAHVLLVPDAPKTNRLALHGECKTSADGTCKINGITPGDYHLYGIQDDRPIDHRDSDLLKAVEEKGKAVTLAEGQQETLEVKVAPGGITALHLVAAEVFVAQVFQHAPEFLAGAAFFGDRGRELRGLQHGIIHEDRAIEPQRQSERVARPRIDGDQFPVALNPDHREERVVLEFVHDHFLNSRIEADQQCLDEIVRHRARRRDLLDFERDGVRFVDSHPDGQHVGAPDIFQDDDRHVGNGVHHQAADLHLDFHVFITSRSDRPASSGRRASRAR